MVNNVAFTWLARWLLLQAIWWTTNRRSPDTHASATHTAPWVTSSALRLIPPAANDREVRGRRAPSGPPGGRPVNGSITDRTGPTGRSVFPSVNQAGSVRWRLPMTLAFRHVGDGRVSEIAAQSTRRTHSITMTRRVCGDKRNRVKSKISDPINVSLPASRQPPSSNEFHKCRVTVNI